MTTYLTELTSDTATFSLQLASMASMKVMMFNWKQLIPYVHIKTQS